MDKGAKRRGRDHATQSVTIDRIYICSTAMQLNNNNSENY